MNSPVHSFEAETKSMSAGSATGVGDSGNHPFNSFNLANIWQRSKAIAFKPEETWTVVRGESDRIEQFIKFFVGPLIIA